MDKLSGIYGAIIGDIAGSRFEFKPHRNKDFELLYSFSGNGYSENQTVEDLFKSSHFTDDTVMTIAVANALIEANGKYDNLTELVVKNMKTFGNKYPYRGYGYNFQQWLIRDTVEPYNSLGNGSAMRISAVPYFAKNIEEVKKFSKMVSEVTHNHPEGIKGAEAVAVAIYLALHNHTKEEILKEIEENYYSLDFDYEELKQSYKFNETCPGSVPQSIFAFKISTTYEDTIRTAISMGGDADTMACISGAIAGAFYGVPNNLKKDVLKFIPSEFIDILNKFEKSIL